MRRLTIFIFNLLLSFDLLAQPSELAEQTAKIIVASSFGVMEKTIPVILSGVKESFRRNGATEKAVDVLAEEMTRALSKEKMESVVANILVVDFSEAELVELNQFLLSEVGGKFLNFSVGQSAERKMSPVLSLACEETKRRLNPSDADSLNVNCDDL